ncbi:hypothetical protein SLU01_18980 [Sporosarcina luteola]|uniref:Uncharacterized protein n=1 Tax=Sporosarcina luteola TaxID=582850 RepID=A0A511Z809_9BACL|nr:hypothetical protein SLU01_18980 [Sporosarcina luteola]
MTTNLQVEQHSQPLEVRKGKVSYFDGGLLQFIGWTILAGLSRFVH